MAERPLPAYDGDEAYIFVTYAHEDADLVYPHLRWLQDQGFNVWWDEGISPGAAWRAEITRAIRGCSLLIYFVTPRSVSTEHCVREVNFALDEYHRPVLAVHLVETTLPDALALSLSDRQAILQHALETEDYERKLITAIATYLDQPLPEITVRAPSRKSSKQAAWRLAMVCSLVVGIVVAVLVFWLKTSTPTVTRPVTFKVQLPDGTYLPPLGGPVLGTDPGGNVFYIGEEGMPSVYQRPSRRTVFFHNLEMLESAPLQGTEDTPGEVLEGLIVAPDGEDLALGYTSVLKRTTAAGGAPSTISTWNKEPAWRFHWGSSDGIALSNGRSLVLVEASGDEVEVVIPGDEQTEIWTPHFLPDGTALLYAVAVDGQPHIRVLRLDTGETHELVKGADPRITASGHLLFVRDGAVWAALFDENELELASDPVAVLHGLQIVGQQLGQYAVAENGTLVYQTDVPGVRHQLVWVSEDGTEEVLGIAPQEIWDPRISRDQVAFTRRDEGLFIYSLTGGLVSRVVDPPGTGDSWLSAWSPDGKQIAFSFWPSGRPNLYLHQLGTPGVERLTKGDGYQWAWSWTPDGQALLIADCSGFFSDCDIGLLPVGNPNEMQLLLHSESNELEPVVSPDGRWLAYGSDEFGPRRVVVRPFPNVADSARQVPIDGCREPRWSPQGNRLYAWCEDGLFAVPVDANSASPLGEPKRLFAVEQYLLGAYDVSADGERILVVKDVSGFDSDLVVVLNWLDEVERLVRTGR